MLEEDFVVAGGAVGQPEGPAMWTGPVPRADKPKEECGVFGVYGHEEAARVCLYGLYALQHRGQESAGIAVSDGKSVKFHKGMGLVSEVFPAGVPSELSRGTAAVGHVRYSTTGSSRPMNSQPLVVRMRGGTLALAHNGNLVNALEIRSRLEREGSIFQTTLDTEVLAHLIARRWREGTVGALLESLNEVRGGYALALLTEDALIGARDPNGIRPLSLGQLGEAWVLASETCAFDTVGARFVRDIEPGEAVVVDDRGLRSYRFMPAGRPALCVFEYIYFARPDSELRQLNVHAVRKNLGRRLAREFPVEADLVTGVPDSSISAASGYAEEAGIPYEMGLIKNRYIGRTFIQPSQAARDLGVKLKLNPLRRVVEGRRVVLVDDSIVRGTTCRHIVALLKEAGAKEVHMRISSPPYRYPCHYGIDTSSRAELIAASRSPSEIEEIVGADSLRYLSLEALVGSINADRDGAAAGRPFPGGLCLSCFDGDYPVEVPEGVGKYCIEDHLQSRGR